MGRLPPDPGAGDIQAEHVADAQTPVAPAAGAAGPATLSGPGGPTSSTFEQPPVPEPSAPPITVAEELDEATKDKFAKKVFQDHRWDNALEFVQGLDDYGPARVHAVLMEGAKAFGIQRLGEASLRGLVKQVMRKEATPSPAMERLADMNKTASLCHFDDKPVPPVHLATKPSVNFRSIEEYITAKVSASSKRPLCGKILSALREANSVFWAWRFLCLLIFLIANGYALKVVFQMYPDATRVFKWPIYFARMGGMAAACWTAVLYWTMARGFLSRIYCLFGGQRGACLVAPLDAHKDLHVLSGGALLACGVEHVTAHLLGTVPGILTSTAEELNGLLGCANADTTPGFISVDLSVLHWPKCPLDHVPRSVEEVLFTTLPGLTGVALSLLLLAMAYTGRAAGRKSRFDVFWYVHNVGIVLWPALLFLHGSNAWVGVGFPLVVFSAGLPIAFYSWDRICRLLRYFLFAGKAVHIVNATVRPGKDGEEDPAKGALTYLEISQPPFLWRFRPGMYAFISMPEYAPLQWHPFTICSGEESDTVDFLIAGVGDWTMELARRCLDVNEGRLGARLPKVALDGPYMAPTQSALAKEVLVAVGAGVGITPFLSLMSTIISGIASEEGSKPLKYERLSEVHFYWMTRSVDEFMFGRKYFTRILQDSALKRKVFIHLHVTARPPNKDASALLFREALKRQSKVDREAFSALSMTKSLSRLAGPLLPACWAYHSTEDVLWLGDLIDSLGRKPSSGRDLRRAYAGHWAQSMAISSAERRKAPTATGAHDSQDTKETVDTLVPVVFGRPNFGSEIRAIGKAQPGKDVHIYVCGNDAVVQNLHDVAAVCNQHATSDAKNNSAPRQTYHVHFERFG